MTDDVIRDAARRMAQAWRRQLFEEARAVGMSDADIEDMIHESTCSISFGQPGDMQRAGSCYPGCCHDPARPDARPLR